MALHCGAKAANVGCAEFQEECAAGSSPELRRDKCPERAVQAEPLWRRGVRQASLRWRGMAMPNYDSIFNAFLTILVTIDPPGLAPLFLGVTRGMNRAERKQVSIRASLIAFFVMAVFALAGATILSLFGITLPAFRVAGGLLLFYIAFEMIFEKRQDRKEKTADVAITRDMIHNIAAFPLAIPLIAGPGAISATVLLSGSFHEPMAKAALIGIIAICILMTYVVFLLAERVDRILGETGRSILTRLLGVMLAALAVQFVADGIRALMAA